MNSKEAQALLFRQLTPFRGNKGAIRKMEIVEAAIQVIATEGVNRLTFESVGKQSRIGKSHVAYHFPDRDDIIKSAIQYVYAVGQAIVVDCLALEKNPEKKLKAYINGAFQWIETHPQHMAVGALLLSLSSVNRTYKNLQTEIRSIGAERIFVILSEMKEARGKTKNLKAKAETIQALILGNLCYYGSAEWNISLKELADRTYEVALKIIK